MLVADQITFSTRDLESNLTLDPIVTRIICDVHRVKCIDINCVFMKVALVL